MPRPPFWLFSLAGFYFLFLMSLISWLNELFFFLGSFAFLVLLSLSHFDTLFRLLSCLDVLAHFYAWWTFSLFMNYLLDESCIPLGMMNFRLFKIDAHFFFLHWWNFISLSFIVWNLTFLWWSLVFSLMNSPLVFHVF